MCFGGCATVSSAQSAEYLLERVPTSIGLHTTETRFGLPVRRAERSGSVAEHVEAKEGALGMVMS